MISVGDDMKKIKWILEILCLVLIGVVHAASNDTIVRVDYWNNVYGNFLIGQEYYWNQMGITYANDKLAYCLEPGKWITESTYDSYTDFNVKNFSDVLKQKLELIAYYGYEYKGHQTQKYYLATQELIWRELGITEMYWSTGSVHSGDRIDVDSEINTIKGLINSHNYMPSFHNQTYELQSGETLRLEDSNGVFEDYELLPPAGHGTTLAGNHLMITAGQVGNSTLSFLRHPNAYRVSLLYTKNDSQAIATFGLSNKMIANVHLKVKGYTLELHKKDFHHNSDIPSGDASLKGAIYQVSDHLMFTKTMETDEHGLAHMADIPAGTYEVKELQASPGYELDSNTYTIHVGMDTALHVTLDVYEHVIEGEVEFVKVMSNGETGIMEPESNVTFGIYNKDNILEKEVTTDERGSAKATLPYGTYTVRQITTTPNYEKVDAFEIHVTEKTTEPIRYVMNDAPVQAKIKLVKQDQYGNRIQQKGIIFKIKNVDTGEYVKQKLEYPEEKIIDEFITNEKGEVTTPYPLEAGHYEVEEIKAPYGYLQSESSTNFTLDENTNLDKIESGMLFTVPIINEAPTGEITVWKYGKSQKLVKNEEGMYDQIMEENPLSGVKFGLYAGDDIIQNEHLMYHSGQFIGEYITENGMAIISDLPLGTYCIKELESLPGYKLDEISQCITLQYQDAFTKVVYGSTRFVNERKNHQVILQKYGEEMTGIIKQKGIYQKVPLANVSFSIITDTEIQNEDITISKDTVLYERVTDKEGKILLEDLPVGTYRIHEIETPTGYQPMEDIIFEVTENEEIQTIELVNTRKKGKIFVMKVDRDTNQTLEGAVFTLYDKNKQVLVKQLETNHGIITLEDIAVGDYELEEIKAPVGYIKERGKKRIRVLEQKSSPVYFQNHKSILPNTSSINRLLYFIIGGMTMICGIAFFLSFVIKKRYGK